MGSFAGATFDERNSVSIARSISSTDPNIRLRAGGGVVVTVDQTPRTARVEAICTTAQLEALRERLILGVPGTLTLHDETLTNCYFTEISNPRNLFGRNIWDVGLTFEVVTTVHTHTIDVTVGSTWIPDVINVSVSTGRLTRFMTATVRCAGRYGERGQPISIFGRVSTPTASGGAQKLFQGIVENVSGEYYPGEFAIQCTGRLRWLQRGYEQEIEYTGMTDGQVVQNMLTRRGVPSIALDIHDDGWPLGVKVPMVVRKGDTFISWIDRIDEVTRYVTFEGSDGKVYRRRNEPTGRGSASKVFTEGDNILSISQSVDPDAIRNHCLVTGLSHEGIEVKGEAFAASAALDQYMPASAPNRNTHTINSSLIETNARANAFAARAVADLAPLQKPVTLTTPFDPTLKADDTITLHSPTLGISGATVRIDDLKHDISGDGGTTTITTNTGNL